MNIRIVDASVAAKWFADEQFADDARRLISEDNQLHVPDFFLLEMDNVLVKWIRRGLITEPEGRDVRSVLRQLPIYTHPTGELRDFAYFIANATLRSRSPRSTSRTGCSFYDCLYLALTALLDGQMVTADRRFYEAMSTGPFDKHLLWVED